MQYRIFYWLIFTLASIPCVHGQEINFRRLNVSNGLSDNTVHSATLDQNGLMWISSAGGLDSYNGFTVKHWPFPNNPDWGVSDMYCDYANSLWMLAGNGSLWQLDSNRVFHPVYFANAADSGRVRYMLPASSDSIYCWVGANILLLNKAKRTLSKTGSVPDSLVRLAYRQETWWSDGKFAIPASNRLLILDPAKNLVEKQFAINRPIAALSLRNGDLLVSTDANRQLFRVDKETGRVKQNYGLLRDQDGKPVVGYLRHMCKLTDGRIMMTTGYGGVYIFDENKNTLTNYKHDPLNTRSISGNNTFRITADTLGNVFITTRSSGLSYFNIKQAEARYYRIVEDQASGQLFDGFVQSFAEDAAGNIWIASQGGLIQFDRGKKTFRFVDYGIVDGENLAGKEEVRSLYVDKNNNLWVGLNRFGVVVLSRAGKPMRYLRTGMPDAQKLAGNFITTICDLPSGELLISSNSGLTVVDPNTFEVVNKLSLSQLDSLRRRTTYAFRLKGSDTVWLGVSNGAYQYISSQNKLKFFGKEQGLSGQYVRSVLPDGKGNVFLAGQRGVDVLMADGSIKMYNQKNGLPFSEALHLLPGIGNQVWVANGYALVLMDADSGVLRIADGRFGVPTTGFRPASGFKAKDGTLFLGTNEGFLTVDPSAQFNVYTRPQLLINSLQSGDTVFHFTRNASIDLTHAQNSFGIEINTIALYHVAALPIEYKLEGYDSDWKKSFAKEAVQYQNVPPGKYVFKVRFSQPDLQAIEPINTMTITITPLWHNTWWFKGILLLLGLAVVYWITRLFLDRRKAKSEALEIERAVFQFANSMHSHQSVNEIVKGITQNSISKLGFEDCVVYLLDEHTKTLHQISAFGPKDNGKGSVETPINIPLGKGIVGSVAATGRAEIVSDTSQDSRYIKDDVVRLSEIAVPIIADEKVIGVIDSEHSHKNFFTQKHLSLLTTLASLLGSRIVSIMADEKKRAAEIALHANQRRTAEVEMQALRAQMNPHFLFNSLNSINNFILKNDADNASAYLTRFSRLMRLILDNSREDWVTLDNELKALRLYIDMESIRFDNSFDFNIDIASNIDLDYVMVPPLIIQPYVENAIWHGLLHRKQPGGLLQIGLTRQNGELRITVEDNGVGRNKSAMLKSKLGEKKKSHGMEITDERLRIVNEVYGVNARASVEDVVFDNSEPSGTRVTLSFQYKHFASLRKDKDR